jgi:hypothetical protein
VQVIALQRPTTKSDTQRRLTLGRQALQVAALISAQLPDQREDALIVLGHAVRIVREWLEADGGSSPPAAVPPSRDSS